MRILVVEDDDTVAFLLSRVLEDQGDQVEHIADGRSAMERLDGQVPDIVVMDYMLPYHSGLDILRSMRERPGWQEVPVLFVTARTDEEDVSAVLGAGANDYITKPFGIDELVARVKLLRPE